MTAVWLLLIAWPLLLDVGLEVVGKWKASREAKRREVVLDRELRRMLNRGMR